MPALKKVNPKESKEAMAIVDSEEDSSFADILADGEGDEANKIQQQGRRSCYENVDYFDI